MANDIEGAIAAFERAAAVTPSRAIVYKELGKARMRAGDVDGAATAYRRYLELSPEAPDRAIVERILSRSSASSP